MNRDARAAALARKIFRTLCLILPTHMICTDAWIVDKGIQTTRKYLHKSNPRTSSYSVFEVVSCTHSSIACRFQPRRLGFVGLQGSESESAGTEGSSSDLKITELNDMDVVVYSLADDEKLCLGAKEDGVLSPISAWTDEPAFGESIEFLVDEVDRFSLAQRMENQSKSAGDVVNGDDRSKGANNVIRIHHLLSEDEVSYGARQAPRGVHNPHGEESEVLYYVDQQLIDRFQIRMDLKPELEILW